MILYCIVGPSKLTLITKQNIILEKFYITISIYFITWLEN